MGPKLHPENSWPPPMCSSPSHLLTPPPSLIPPWFVQSGPAFSQLIRYLSHYECPYEPQLKLLTFGKGKIGIVVTVFSLSFSQPCL